MPRYYFVIRAKDGQYDDPSGSDLPNIEAAKAYAHRIIEELKEGGPSSRLRDAGCAGRDAANDPFHSFWRGIIVTVRKVSVRISRNRTLPRGFNLECAALF